MRISFRLLSLFLLLLLVGAGCFGGKKADRTRDGGIFTSIDAGQKWKQTTAFPSAQGVGSIGTADVLALAIDPSDRQILYLGTKENGLLMSEDGGQSWRQPHDAKLRDGAIRSIAVDPTDICTVFAAAGSRLYRTETCGRTFQSVYQQALNDVALRRVVIDWYNPDDVYIGFSNGDLLKSEDRGTNWTKILSAKESISNILVSNSDSRIVLVGTEKGVYKSTDAGLTWTKLEDALKDFKEGDSIVSFVQDDSGEVIFAATKYGLLRSKDVGETWEALKLVTAPGQIVPRALAVDPGNPDTIYYATASTLYTSTSGGAAWKTQKLPSSRAASVLQVDPENPGTIYLGVLLLEK